jgi:hypothetical protein
MVRIWLALVAPTLLGSASLYTQGIKQPPSVYPIPHVLPESLWDGEQILADRRDPNAAEWRIGRAPVRAAMTCEPGTDGNRYRLAYVGQRFLLQLLRANTRPSAGSDEIEGQPDNPVGSATTNHRTHQSCTLSRRGNRR